MKKFCASIFILLLLSGGASSEQSAEPELAVPLTPITGLGEFKIGMTIDEFKAKYQVITTVPYNNVSYIKNPGAYKIEPSVDVFSGKAYANGNHCPESDEFIVHDYQTAGIKFSPELHFHKGHLVGVSVNTWGLNDLGNYGVVQGLKAKYGNSHEEYKEEEKTCQPTFSNSSIIKYTQKKYLSKWKGENGIEAWASTTSLLKIGSCKSTMMNLYGIYDTEASKASHACSREHEKIAEKKYLQEHQDKQQEKHKDL